MINSFSQFIVEEERVVYFTFGRMNPPTVGHGKLLDILATKAGRAPYKVFLSQTNDKRENPLPYSDKIKHVRKMFPKHARNVMINKKVRTPFEALSALYDQGFRKVVMVAGSDRVPAYTERLNRYNGVKGQHGFYNFKGGVQVISAGQRDPDATGVEGASGTKQRTAVTKNDFTAFAQGLPDKMSNADARRLFNDVRKGMGLKEEKTFAHHIALEPVSDVREAFVKGKLFSIGDTVVVKQTEEVGTVSTLGSNYVIVEFTDGSHKRKWLDAVELIEANQPEWGTPQSTQKAKSVTPGESNAMDKVKDKIAQEKQLDRKRHDQMLDRARIAVAKQKNRGTM